MKKATLYSIFVFAYLLTGCSQIDYTHPLDSAITYDHPEFFNDDNNDSLVNLWDTSSAEFKSHLDTIPPTLTLNGQNPTTITYQDPNHIVDYLKSDKAYNVDDDRGKENVTVEVRNTDFSVIFPNTNEIQYIARDKAGNITTVPRTVIVLPQAFVDTVKPQISVSMVDVQIYQNETFDKMKNVRAYDEPDGDITSKITVTGEVNTAKPGEYTLTYKVSDNAGNEYTLVRKITVLESTTGDDIFPVITLTGGDTVTIEETATWKELGYKAEDNKDGNITDSVKVSGSVKSAPGWYTITYTVSDKAMNITTKTRYVRRKGTILVGDTLGPVISLLYPKDTLVTVIKGAVFKVPEVRIQDNVDGPIPKESLYTFPKTVNTSTVGTIKVALLAKDKADNEGRLDITVKIVEGTVDKTPPVITLKGKNPDTVYVSASAPYKDSGATATDDVDKTIPVSSISVKGVVDRKVAGTYTLTYTAYDVAGNADSVKRIVVVKESSSSDLIGKYEVLTAPALPSVNKSYYSAEIEGDAASAPNLTAMKEFKINWDKSQKQIYDMSMNFTTINYVSLTGKGTNTLDKASPTLTFTGVTQVPKLDGEYYVVVSGTDLVFVKNDGSFAIIMKP